MFTVTSLYRFLVKSCGSTSVWTLEVGERGPVRDRVYMFVRPGNDHEFMSQRDFPGLCLVRPELAGDTVALYAPYMPYTTLPIAPEGRRKIQVTMHNRQFQATVSECATGKWLAEFLDLPFKPLTVFQSADDVRTVRPGAAAKGVGLGLQDGYPFMMLGTASLGRLNLRLPEDQYVTMDRFRPTIVSEGGVPHSEDRIKRMRINGIELVGESLCMRCPTIQTNQQTSARGREPMKTLLEYRPVRADNSGKKSPVFGRNFSHLQTGVLEVGAPIDVLEWEEA